MVPWWALAVVAALVVFGGGYLVGHAVGDDGSDRAVRVVNPANPFGGNNNPFGGNGEGVPNPFGGNGNGNGNNGGNGDDGGNGNGSSNTSTAFLGVAIGATPHRPGRRPRHPGRGHGAGGRCRAAPG